MGICLFNILLISEFFFANLIIFFTHKCLNIDKNKNSIYLICQSQIKVYYWFVKLTSIHYPIGILAKRKIV